MPPVRTLQLPLCREIRTADDGTLTISGTAVPYDEDLTYAGVVERFDRGAFAPEEAVGRPLLWSHERAEQVGHITAAETTPDGLGIDAVVQPTTRGRDLQTLIRAGSLDGMSVGFEPLEWVTREDEAIVYTKCKLLEVSLTPLPAFESATISSTREREPMTVTTEPAPAVAVAEVPAPDVPALVARLDALEARGLPVAHALEAKPSDTRAAFVRQLLENRDGRVRALADVVSSGNAGILPLDWTSQVRDTLDSTRYMIPRVGKIGFPTSGDTLSIPKILTHAVVAARGAQKSEIPSGPVTTGNDIYSATWYAGGVDVALELARTSTPSIMGLVVDSLFSQYAAVTDQAFTTAAETNGTATGSALDFTSYEAFIADVLATGEAIRAATGAFGDMLSLTTASWGKFLGMTTPDGRRVLATIGPTNADGTAPLTAGATTLGGITIYHNARAAKDVQYNVKSLLVAELPPTQLQATNVAQLGYDVGVYGALMDVPLYPAGIKVYSVVTGMAASAEGRRR